MIKILEISTVGLSFQGITTVIYNYTKHIDSDKINIQYVAWNDINPEIKEKFEKLGKVHLLPNRRSHTIKYIERLYRLFQCGYDIVHIHGNSGTVLIEVILAKLVGVKKIILHSHNTSTNHPYIDKVTKWLSNLWADERIACSFEAGRWLFGKREFVVLNNAIDIEKFTFDSDIRKKMRKELNINDEYLIGNIGHFSLQKNQEYLIEVFSLLHKEHPNTKLLLVGDGNLFEKAKIKVSELGLNEAVIFTGKRSDSERLYQAMDIFVLPSIWEGLGIVLVEAQAADIPVLASSVVPSIAKCTNRLEYFPLEKGQDAWAEKIWSMLTQRENKRGTMDTLSLIAEHGYDIKTERKKLENIYKSLL